MPTIDEQLRFFAVKVNGGSGCLFQPDSKDYTYVLTVKHNLEVENQAKQKVLMALKDIKIYQGNVEGEAIHKVIAFETHETLDLALIVIPYIGDSEMALTYSSPTKNELLFLYGYPSRLKNEKEKREDVRCFCNMQREDGLGTEIRTEQGQHTWDINTQKAMLGFSGSGIFADINGILVLKGIFPELKDPTGANDKLISLHISNFNSIADKLDRKHLLPSNLLSFKPYKTNAFKRVNPGLKNLFNNNIEQIANNKEISPIAIAKRNKNSLTLPIALNYWDSVSQSKLWEAWLELLTVLNIVLPEYQDLESCCSKIPLYFSANENHIKRLIKLFLSDIDLKKQVKKDSLIAFSSNQTSGGKEFLNKEEVKKIVANLNQPDFFNDKMMIGNATQVPGFSCIHIDHFSTKIDQLEVDQLERDEILQLLRQEILNILNYAL